MAATTGQPGDSIQPAGAAVLPRAFASIGMKALMPGILARLAYCNVLAQYASINTLVYAHVSAAQTSAASTIAATGQQLAFSFGVAGAALVAAIFVPSELHSYPGAIVHGVQQAFLALGALTILSSVVFMELKADGGADMSNHDAAHRHRQEEH